jgi:hypothetical protein
MLCDRWNGVVINDSEIHVRQRLPIGRASHTVPCHRVTRNTGAFGDCRWGALRKRILLSRELAQAQAA